MDLELLQAAKRGDLPLFRQLANQNPGQLLATTPQSNTILHLAARQGHAEILAEALRRQASLLMLPNSKGDSALHVASRAGHLPAVDFLLKWAGGWSSSAAAEEGRRGGASVAEVLGMRNKANYTALHEAVWSGRVKVVALLAAAAAGLETEQTEVDGGKPPVYLAAEMGLVGMVRLLLGGPYCSSLTGPGGRSALHAAVVQGHYDVAKALLERFPKLVKQEDASKICPLHCAAAMGNLKMAKLLLHLDSSTAYDLDNCGRSPIHMAAINGHAAIVREMFHCCPDSVELLDSRGCNILHLAVESEKLSVIEYILEDSTLEDLLNDKDVDGNTPLHIAAMNRSLSIVYLLCTHKGVDTGLTNIHGLTALDIAELDEEPSTRVRKFRILRALKLVGARRGMHEDDMGMNVPRAGPTDPALLESYKSRANTLSLVAILISTVTFAAAFTLPGGYQNSGPNEGLATLIKKASLQAFLVADTVAMCSSIIAAFLLIWAAIGDQDLLVQTLRFSMELMWLALQSMAVAFVTGVYAVASESKWLIIVVSVLGCIVPSTVSLVLLSNLLPLPLRWRRSNSVTLLKLFVLDFTSMIAFDDLDGKSSFWSTLTKTLFWRAP